MRQLQSAIMTLHADLESDARTMVGDGQLPNKYFVSVSNDYNIMVTSGEMEGIEGYLKGFKSQGRTVARFDTYNEAKEFVDTIALGSKDANTTVIRVTIEDRLSGEVYEKTKIFDAINVAISEEEHESISYTRNKLGEDFE